MQVTNQNSGRRSLDIANSITRAILTNNILTRLCYTWIYCTHINDLGSRLATTLTHVISEVNLYHHYVIYPMTGMEKIPYIQMTIEY